MFQPANSTNKLITLSVSQVHLFYYSCTIIAHLMFRKTCLTLGTKSLWWKVDRSKLSSRINCNAKWLFSGLYKQEKTLTENDFLFSWFVQKQRAWNQILQKSSKSPSALWRTRIITFRTSSFSCSSTAVKSLRRWLKIFRRINRRRSLDLSEETWSSAQLSTLREVKYNVISLLLYFKTFMNFFS